MLEECRFVISEDDPEVTIAFPLSVLEDLCQRAAENGQHFEVEVVLRLLRTLERDAVQHRSDILISKIFSQGVASLYYRN